MAYAGYGLPGRVIRELSPGQPCEFCEEAGRPVEAKFKVQGETDSFGYETHFLCQECTNKARNNVEKNGNCEWCKVLAPCHPTRDPDEGSGGPVYWVCVACDKKMMQALAEEMAS